MPIEFDDRGLRIFGTGEKGIRFYDNLRKLKREIYLKPDGTLNIEGGTSGSGGTVSGAPDPHALDSAHHTGEISDAQHGARSGGDLHAAATATTDGFMSATDKDKLDKLVPDADPGWHYAESFGGQTAEAWTPVENGIGAPDGSMVIKEVNPGVWMSIAYYFKSGGVLSDGNWAVYKWGGTGGEDLHAIVGGEWVSLGTLPSQSIITPADITGYSADIDGAIVEGIVIGCGGNTQRFDAFGIYGAGGGDTGQLAVWDAPGVLRGRYSITDAQHGARGGGSLHSVATTGSAGFMSAADKTKLDGLGGGALADLSDVALATPTNGQALVYDDSIGKWKNGTAGGGGSFSGASVYRSAALTVNHATTVVLEFSGETYDVGGYWSAGNPSRLTAPAAGYYQVTGNIRWGYDSAAGERYLWLRINGAGEYLAMNITGATGAANATHQWSLDLPMAAGDYVEVFLHQTSGGALSVSVTDNTYPRMSMARLG